MFDLDRRTAGLVILVLAYVLLVPGLIKPMLYVDAYVKNSGITKMGKQYIEESNDIPKLFKGTANMMLDYMDNDGEMHVYNKTQSILGTIRQLFEHGYFVVAILIMLFSVIIPAVKGLMMLTANLNVKPVLRRRAMRYSGMISKWSMADVFVIAIMVAYLAANAITDDVINFVSRFGPGFYFFLAYCVLSVASAQILGGVKSQLTDSDVGPEDGTGLD